MHNINVVDSQPQPILRIPADQYGVAPLLEYQDGERGAPRIWHWAGGLALGMITAEGSQYRRDREKVTEAWERMSYYEAAVPTFVEEYDSSLSEAHAEHDEKTAKLRDQVESGAISDNDFAEGLEREGRTAAGDIRNKLHRVDLRGRLVLGTISEKAATIVDRSVRYNTLGPNARSARTALKQSTAILDKADLDEGLTESVIADLGRALETVGEEGPARTVVVRALYERVLAVSTLTARDNDYDGYAHALAGIKQFFSLLKLGPEGSVIEQFMVGAIQYASQSQLRTSDHKI